MEYVENKTFFHINSINSRNKRFLRVGDKLNIGENYNPYREGYEYGFGLVTNDIQVLLGTITLYWHFTIETIFEEERIKINPELPSRMKSLWLSNESCIPYWQEKIIQGSQDTQVIKLKVSGKILACDAHWVELQPTPLKKVRENARHYWNGIIKNKDKVEYLFEGSAEVIEIL